MRIYLLQSLVDLVITYHHDSVVGLKTLLRVKESFFWPTLKQDITSKVQACSTCAVSNPEQNTRHGYLTSTVPNRPMEKLHTDFIAKLPRTKKGNNMILVAVDQFSKFTWLISVRKATSIIAPLRLKAKQSFRISVSLKSSSLIVPNTSSNTFSTCLFFI